MNDSNTVKQTRANIFQAFWRLYYQKAFRQLNVKEIIKVAGYNRSTFYKYFQDIIDLRQQAEKELVKQISNCIKMDLNQSLTIDAAFEKALNDILGNFNQPLRRLLLSDPDPTFHLLLSEVMEKLTINFIQQSDFSVKNQWQIEFFSKQLTASLMTTIDFQLKHPEIDKKQTIHNAFLYINGGGLRIFSRTVNLKLEN